MVPVCSGRSGRSKEPLPVLITDIAFLSDGAGLHAMHTRTTHAMHTRDYALAMHDLDSGP